MERTFSYAGRIPAFMMLRMRPLLEFREKRTALNGLITENFFTEHAELVRAVPVLPDQLFHPVDSQDIALFFFSLLSFIYPF